MENISYIPILKTKRAEFTALSQLDSSIKSKVIPLLEIEPIPLDPDTDIPEKTYNDMLTGFEQKIASSCDGIPTIFLDGVLIEEQFIDSGDIYPIINAVNQARKSGVRVIPVTSPTRTPTYQAAINSLLKGEVCLRLTTTDLANPQLISTYVTAIGLAHNNIDVIIDLRDMITEDNINSGLSKMLAIGLVNNLPNVLNYRTLTLAAGSFPMDLSNISVGVYSQGRFEWMLWKDLHISGELVRPIIYSDYGVQHPDYARLATRFPSATASIRYTGNDDFWVFRGQVARRYGYEQYGAHSQRIVVHSEYSGAKFCTGDKEIEDYAKTYTQYLQNPTGNYKFGSPEVWRRIGQNHHITKVVDQLSNLYGL